MVIEAWNRLQAAAEVVYSVFLEVSGRVPQLSTLFPYTTLFRSRSSGSTRAARCASGRRAPERTRAQRVTDAARSEEHTSELQSRLHLVCRLLLEKKKTPTGQQRKNAVYFRARKVLTSL